MTNRPDGFAAFQRDLRRLQKWADRNIMKFSKDNRNSYQLRKINPMHQYSLGATQVKNCLAEKALGTVWTNGS